VNHDSHRALRESLGAYALDQLDEHQRLALDAHLSGCADCQAELAELLPVVRGLRLVDPARVTEQPAPPPGLADTVVAAVLADTPARRHRTYPRWISAAAAVLALIAGAGVGWLLHPDVPAVPLEPVAVSGLAPGLDATAGLVPHTWGVEIKLTGTGFPTGRPFRVSIIDEQGRRSAAGEFVGTGSAAMNCNLNTSVLRAQARGFEVADDRGTVVLASRF